MLPSLYKQKYNNFILRLQKHLFGVSYIVYRMANAYLSGGLQVKAKVIQ